MAVLPQFPLGSVLFPTMVLPLHVFEPRYQALIRDVTEAEQTFGVVLIERGSEVGGDDQRSSFGTVAKIVEAQQFNDGRWAIITVGTERFKVIEWLEDDPYPRAEIEPWPDETTSEVDRTHYELIVAKFGRCMALASESGLNVGPVPEALDDPELGSLQMSALAPVATMDKQALLGAPGTAERIRLLDQSLDDALELIHLRLTDWPR